MNYPDMKCTQNIWIIYVPHEKDPWEGGKFELPEPDISRTVGCKMVNFDHIFVQGASA